MLEQITVKNLGCFDDQTYTVDFSDETLLAGPNNSGKTMLLAAMNFLRYYLVTGTRRWNSDYYYLHSFKAAINNHDTMKTIEISFTLKEMAEKYVFVWKYSTQRGINEIKCNNNTINPGDPQYLGLLKKIWCLRPNRSLVPYDALVEPTAGELQPLRPTGSNVINFLLGRWTDRDKKWVLAESWLKKIDPDMSMLKTPIIGQRAFLETTYGDTDVNLSLQGSGFQSAAAIVSAVVFSPEGSTLIIEEPEVFLHPNSQETIVDMINDAVNNHNKQVIFSTHSCNILLPFYNDVGLDAPKRGKEHIIADPKKFSMWTFEKVSGKVSIKPYPLHEKTFQHFRQDFKYIWG